MRVSSDKADQASAAAAASQRASGAQGKRTPQQSYTRIPAQEEDGKEEGELGLCALTKSFIQLFLATMVRVNSESKHVVSPNLSSLCSGGGELRLFSTFGSLRHRR